MPASALPHTARPLIGRAAEIAAVRGLLLDGDARLVTLTGPGGVGKTRLALAVASSLDDAAHAAHTAAGHGEPPRMDGRGAGGAGQGQGYAQTVFVDLAPLTDPALVVPAIAAALGVREAAGTALPAGVAQAIVQATRERRLLLVLDNCEHLLDAAPAVGELLAACADLLVLATSREPLGLQWERLFPVPPLALPALPGPGGQLTTEAAAASPAVALFVQRARALSPGFALAAENTAAVVETCRLLDGLPLALELAASRVRLLPPAALLARLRGRLDLLESRERDRPARHQTLRGAIAWSYDLLSPEERAVFRRLGVFAGGFTLEAAEVVCAGGESGMLGYEHPHDASGVSGAHAIGGAAADTLAVLGSLLDKSLVVEPAPSAMPAVGPAHKPAATTSDLGGTASSPQGSPGEPRFRLLETVREFAAAQLAAAGEAVEAVAAHGAYFAARVEDALAEWRALRRHGFYRLIEPDHDNLRAALRRALDRRDVETAARLAGVLWLYWFTRGFLSEGRAALDDVLGVAAAAGEAAMDVAARRRVYLGAAAIAFRVGDAAAGQPLALESHRRALRLGDDELAAESEVLSGLLALRLGAFDDATPLLERGLAWHRARGSAFWETVALNSLGMIAAARGDAHAAAARWRESLDRQRAVGDRWGMSEALYLLGMLGARTGDPQAGALLLEGADCHLEIDDTWGVARCLEALAALCLRGSDSAAPAAPAAACRAGAAGVGMATSAPSHTAERAAAGARLLGAAAAFRARLGSDLAPDERDPHERSVAAARAALPGGAFESAFAAGAALSLREALDLAGAVVAAGAAAGTPASGGPLPPRQGQPAPASDETLLLSAREREVAALIARGLTSKEIARALIITERTADTHAEHIRDKLNLRSRAEIAAWAVRQGLAAALGADNTLPS